MNRRDFVSKSGLLLGVAGSAAGSFLLDAAGSSQAQTAKPALEAITEHVSLYRDAVNVGVIRRNGKTLLIDSARFPLFFGLV